MRETIWYRIVCQFVNDAFVYHVVDKNQKFDKCEFIAYSTPHLIEAQKWIANNERTK
jgi:hypothetical protein